MDLKLSECKRFLEIVKVDSIDELEQLEYSLTKKVKKYRFLPQVINGSWSGDISFFDDKNHRMSSGLWKFVHDTLIKYKYSSKLYGIKRLFNNDINYDEFKDFTLNLMKGHSKTPREYQIKAAYNILKFRRSSSLLSTSSGKTLIIFIVFSYGLKKGLMKNILMIVPSVSLVVQGSNDFLDYNRYAKTKMKIQQVFHGQEPVHDENITIGTYQSLVKFDKEYFKKFDAVVIDECLHPDALILMADNTYKKIKNIVAGDLVKTKNDVTNIIEDREVDFVYKNLSRGQNVYEVELENGETLILTGNHKIKLTDGSWKECQYLSIEDDIEYLFENKKQLYSYIIDNFNNIKNTNLKKRKILIFIKGNKHLFPKDFSFTIENHFIKRLYYYLLDNEKCLFCNKDIRFKSFDLDRKFCSKNCKKYFNIKINSDFTENAGILKFLKNNASIFQALTFNEMLIKFGLNFNIKENITRETVYDYLTNVNDKRIGRNLRKLIRKYENKNNK